MRTLLSKYKGADAEDTENLVWWMNYWIALLAAIAAGVIVILAINSATASAEKDRLEEQAAVETAETQELIADLSDERHVLREPAERYRDKVAGCENTAIVFTDPNENPIDPALAEGGGYNAAYFREFNVIEIRHDYPQNLHALRELVVHECAHVLQSNVYETDDEYGHLLDRTYEIYGDIERAAPLHQSIEEYNTQGIEQHADCISEVWNQETNGDSFISMNYAEDIESVCSGDGLEAAVDVFNGDTISLD